MNEFDSNGDGVISKEELNEVIKKQVQAEKEKALSNLKTHIDKEAVMWEDEMMKHYHNCFDYTDTDGDGEVTYSELVAAMESETGLAQISAKVMKAMK
jgi:Ca2+-binding EF-hand superfamily protein